MIDVLEIVRRHKLHPVAFASAADFTCQLIGQADPSRLINDPTLSLYCFDHPTRRALFVQVPTDVDISAGPFMYMAQHDHAQRVAAVPYDVFHSIAAGIELQTPLAFIYSTGRSGSTLMSKALGELEATTSVSEPDVFTQAVRMRFTGVQDDEIRDLVRSAIKVLFNPAFTGKSTLHVVKFRSFCIQIADLLSTAFPDAGNLFLYRDLAPSIRSYAQAFGALDRPPGAQREVLAEQAAFAPLLAQEFAQRKDLDGIEGLCLLWLSAMHAYADHRRLGIPILAVRYEELLAHPGFEMDRILAYLGLAHDRVPDALRAFQRDSQAASPLSRESVAQRLITISGQQWALVRDLMRRYPLAGPDIPAGSMVVP